MALKTAANLGNEDDDSAVRNYLLKNLIENRGTLVKRRFDATKSLFATILDYGGPALAKSCKKK